MNIVNIMNFVRGCEPRDPEIDLVLPIKEELMLCNKYGWKNTCLMQYDAMLREDIVSVVKELGVNTEFGIWIEMCRALIEKVGLKWRGREGWDWDWYVNPGFLQAYTQDERKLIIDEIMKKFYETFDCYPESVGSWILDAYSIEYMQKKYNVKAFGICREQFGIDAYTLVGGYYNQAYYPSKYNSICPATTKENQVNAPVFRLLGPDPIYNYGADGLYGRVSDNPPTIEPVWKMGTNEDKIKWFFDSYFERESLAFSYIQLGQENSFGWERINNGLKKQFELLKKYAGENKCSIMTMGESGKWFIDNFKETPPTALGAKDVNNKDITESQWYNCKNYRVNIVSEGDRLYIRDIYKFNEKYVESSYDKPCKQWKLTYDNLPVMDGFLWKRDDTDRAGIYFDGKYQNMRVYKNDGKLVVEANFKDEKVYICMSEEKIEINTNKQIRFIINDNVKIDFRKDKICYEHNNISYNVSILGSCDKKGVITPDNGKILFFMNN